MITRSSASVAGKASIPSPVTVDQKSGALRVQDHAASGEGKGTIISNTATHTPPAGTTKFVALQAVTEVVVNTFTIGTGWGGTLAGVTIPAGVSVLVPFTSISLTSGVAAVNAL